MKKKQITGEDLQAAWQEAQDAWVRAGKYIPCYEENYMIARKKLADLYRKIEQSPLTRLVFHEKQ